MPRCGVHAAGGVRQEPSQGTERQASLHQHFLAGHFTGRFPTSYSSIVPHILGLAAVSRGRLGLPPVQETCTHLQPPPVQRQAQDNLPEREVPKRPVPTAAADLRRDDKVSQGMPCRATAASCHSPLSLFTKAASAVLWVLVNYLFIFSLSCLPLGSLGLCSNLLIPELAVQERHRSSELVVLLDAGAHLFIYLFATCDLNLFGSQALWRRGPHHFQLLRRWPDDLMPG